MGKRNVNIAPNLARMAYWESHLYQGLEEYDKGPDFRYGDSIDGLNSSTAVVPIVRDPVQPSGLAGVEQIATYIFDPSGDETVRSAAEHTLNGPTIPDDAIVTQAWYHVKTTCASTEGGTDKGTLAFHLLTANDIFSAAAIETGTALDAPTVAAGVPVGTAATMIKMTAAAKLKATVGTAAFTAGKVVVYIRYVTGI